MSWSRVLKENVDGTDQTHHQARRRIRDVADDDGNKLHLQASVDIRPKSGKKKKRINM